MHYIVNSESVTREYFNILELIRDEELIATQFYQIHYEGYMLRGIIVKELL